MSNPEIIFIHGILGADLVNPRLFIRDKIWLDPKEFISGDLAEKLSLKADGVTDVYNGFSLRAEGHLEFIYGVAATTWRLEGLRVHEFSFDWRKSISLAADQLHQFIEGDFAKHGKKYLIVAHSMGGLVASLYAKRHHPHWESRIEHAVFMGTPLRGSYAPIEAILGTYPLIKKLALAVNNDDTEDLRKMAASLVGLIEMFPDPAIFPDANDAYLQQVWPDAIVPQQAWLDQSKNIKNDFSDSPLLKKTTLLVSLNYGTVSSINNQAGIISPGSQTGIGDGTVPAKSAVADGVTAYKVNFEHSLLPLDPLCIKAVIDIARGNQPSLNRVRDIDLIRSSAVSTFRPLSNFSFSKVALVSTIEITKWLFTTF